MGQMIQFNRGLSMVSTVRIPQFLTFSCREHHLNGMGTVVRKKQVSEAAIENLIKCQISASVISEVPAGLMTEMLCNYFATIQWM